MDGSCPHERPIATFSRMSPSVSKAYQERGVTKSGIVSYESAMAALKTAVLYYAAKNASINSLWLPEMVDRCTVLQDCQFAALRRNIDL